MALSPPAGLWLQRYQFLAPPGSPTRSRLRGGARRRWPWTAGRLRTARSPASRIPGRPTEAHSRAARTSDDLTTDLPSPGVWTW